MYQYTICWGDNYEMWRWTKQPSYIDVWQKESELLATDEVTATPKKVKILYY